MEYLMSTLLVYSGGLIAFWVMVVCAQPHYEVQINFPISIQYRPDTNNTLADGTCCEPNETAPNCVTGCSNIRVILCVREEDHPIADMDVSNCPLGALTTPLTRAGLFTFTAIPGVTNTTFFPGQVQLPYRIEDGIQSNSRPIECGRFIFKFPIVDRENGNFLPNAILGKNRIATLNLPMVRIVCKENYIGSDCGISVCEPQDDSTGHFNCTINGSKVCLPGYQIPETNCVEVVPTMIPTTETTISTMETTSIHTTPPSTTTSTTTPVGMDIVPIAAGATTACLVILLLILIINTMAVALIKKSRNRRQPLRVEGVNPRIDDISMETNPVYDVRRNIHEQETEVYYETVQ